MVELKNSMLTQGALGETCFADSWGTITSNGNNLDSQNSCHLTAAGDITNTNPLLGPLHDNGGRTLTHALLPGSPAIDAGDDLACAAAPVNGIDQRGVPRPQGAACDIGAYEYVLVDTMTTLTSSLNPSTFGESVTFTATVTSTLGIPTGMVTFTVDAGLPVTQTLDASGVITYGAPALMVGKHSVLAEYGGDSAFFGSLSNTLNQTVDKASTATDLASSPNPSISGRAATFTATVTSTIGTPTGIVTFTVDAGLPATRTLDANGIATSIASALMGGEHTISAEYSGDSNFNMSGADLVQVVEYRVYIPLVLP